MKTKISIIVCTHNRGFFIGECLQSIVSKKGFANDVELLVIDNSSNDGTEDVVVSSNQVDYIKYYYERKIGLSYARNMGMRLSTADWLCYIDDDAKIHSDYLERAFWVIGNCDFDCFGGIYYAWYPFGKPKWIPKSFGTKIPPRNTLGYIDVPDLSGNNFLIKKEVLEKVGGFPIEYGMTGKTTAYGEENVVQMKLLKMGYKLGFDPELKIDHAVLPHKLKLSWHLKSWYAHGRDGQRFSREYSFNHIVFLFFRSLIGAFLKLPAFIGKLVMNKNYYWQNLVWDMVSPVFYRVGQFEALFR